MLRLRKVCEHANCVLAPLNTLISYKYNIMKRRESCKTSMNVGFRSQVIIVVPGMDNKLLLFQIRKTRQRIFVMIKLRHPF